MQPRPSGLISGVRGLAASVLVLLMVAAIHAQPPKTDPDKKDSDKKDTKPPEIKWPTDINGKDIYAVMKDIEDPDPVIRDFAVRTLPLFGPPAQKKEVSKLLLKRMAGAEKDPSVRVAVFNTVGQIQFEDEKDNVEALRLLTIYVDNPIGPSAALYRMHAIQTIAMFGPKGEGAITALTRNALNDPSYETRRNLAKALASVGFNEKTGPNMKALRGLANVLAKDESASVRMEAMQSLMILGPPWATVMQPGAKGPPKIKVEDAAEIIKYLRLRVGDPNATPPKPGLEKDKQVEIWARLVLMRFDPKEVNDENLDAIARYLIGNEVGVKGQALNALTIVGELAARKVMDVVRVMEDKNAPYQLTVASINTLAAMGAGAKPALPNLKKLLEEKKIPLAEKKAEIEKLEAAKKKVEPQLAGEKIALEEMVKLLEAVIKHIEEAKPMSPSGSAPSDPKKP